jgi:5-methylcytosine-specific restriction endonuclease McrA
MNQADLNLGFDQFDFAFNPAQSVLKSFDAWERSINPVVDGSEEHLAHLREFKLGHCQALRVHELPTIERLREVLVYVPETGAMLWAQDTGPGKRIKAGTRAGTVKRNGRVHVRVDGVDLLAHRVAYALMEGRWPEQVIDHIVPLTVQGGHEANRWSNLRAISQKDNSRRQQRRRDNPSGVIGVTQCPRTGTWKPTIRVNGKLLHLGTHERLVDAIQARYAAEARYFGQFAPHIDHALVAVVSKGNGSQNKQASGVVNPLASVAPINQAPMVLA